MDDSQGKVEQLGFNKNLFHEIFPLFIFASVALTWFVDLPALILIGITAFVNWVIYIDQKKIKDGKGFLFILDWTAFIWNSYILVSNVIFFVKILLNNPEMIADPFGI